MHKDKPFWFEVKSYGWGWSLPVTWQGWTVVLVYSVLLLTGMQLITNPGYRWGFLILSVAALVSVVAWKGEKPLKWRWGRD